MVAEGTSLRLTQRSDYASYLSRNNNNIDALITAMQQQVAQAGMSDALIQHHAVAVLLEAVAFGHADAAEHDARAEVALPGDRDDPVQAGLFVTEAQRGAGGLTRQAATLRLGP